MVNTVASATAMHAEAPARAGGFHSGLRVVYVVSLFPSFSETFILREIHTLLDEGVDVRIVSVRDPSDRIVQDEAKVLLDRVHYPAAPHRSLLRMLRELVTRPATTLRTPQRIILQQWRKPEVMFKSLVAWFRMFGVMEAIEEFDPDHVHAHWATYASTAAMVLSDHLGRSFSFTAHAHDIFIEEQLMPEKLASAAFVATISRYNRSYLRAKYLAAEKADIQIIHCGVRNPAARRVANRGPNDRSLVVSVGRHDEVKGFPTLLQACRILRDDGVDFRCEIIGDGPLRGMLEREIRNLGLADNVVLLGARPSAEVDQKLAKADLFVLASERASNGNMDGIPVALMEAMASGTPVVSTQISGIPELVENEQCGLTVPPSDPVALAHAMRRMLRDESLRERCAEAGRKKVFQEFDSDKEARRLLKLFKTITGGQRAKETVDSY